MIAPPKFQTREVWWPSSILPEQSGRQNRWAPKIGGRRNRWQPDMCSKEPEWSRREDLCSRLWLFRSFCGTGSRREIYSSRGGADSVGHLSECGWQKPNPALRSPVTPVHWPSPFCGARSGSNASPLSFELFSLPAVDLAKILVPGVVPRELRPRSFFPGHFSRDISPGSPILPPNGNPLQPPLVP